jgi:hypothetical protein
MREVYDQCNGHKEDYEVEDRDEDSQWVIEYDETCWQASTTTMTGGRKMTYPDSQ